MFSSSTGGRIIEIEGGLRHYGNTDRFDYERQNSVDRTELKAQWHPLLVPDVTPTSPPGRIVSFN